MRMKVQCVLLVLVAGSTSAQEPAVSASHQRVAEELVGVMRLEEAAARSVEMMTKTLASQNPVAAQIQDVIEEFYTEHMSWDTLRPTYVTIYMNAFTEAEIVELIEFYHTPLGQRLIEQTPVIAEQSVAAAQAIIQPHMPELQRRMMARIGGGL